MNESPELEVRTIDSLNASAWNTMLQGPEAALRISHEACDRARECGYAQGLAAAILNIGWCEFYLSQFSNSLKSFSAALAAFRAIPSRCGEMKALNASGAVYETLGKYDTAVDLFMQSLEISRESENPDGEISALNNLGELFRDCGNGDESLRYFLRAMDVLNRTDNRELAANVYANVGASFKELGNLPLAMEYLESAFDLSEKSNDAINTARCHVIMGQIAIELGRAGEAESHFDRALATCESAQNKLGRVSVLQSLGELRRRQERPEDALELYRQSVDLAVNIGAAGAVISAYRNMSSLFETVGRTEEALVYFRKFYDAERVTLNEDTKNRVRNITAQYEIEKSQREAEIYRLKNVELREKSAQLEERSRQLLSLSRIGQRITSSLDMEQVMLTVYESLRELMDVNSFGIALYDETVETINYKLFLDDSGRVEPFTCPVTSTESFAAWCITHDHEVFINDKDREKAGYIRPDAAPPGAVSQSLIFLPLHMEKRIIGVITVQSRMKNAYRDEDLKVLTVLSGYVAIALENSLVHDRVNRLNEELTAEKTKLEEAARRIAHLANHDNLTGIPNRRLMHDLLAAALPQADRTGSKVAVLYIDLDDFKPINDSYGHRAGDAALVAVTERFKRLLRASDTIARIGGDEFVAFVTNVRKKADVGIVLDKLFEDCRRPLDVLGRECSISFSVGIALYPDDDRSVEGLLAKADAAMYLVKHHEKHGYRFYEGKSGEMQLP